MKKEMLKQKIDELDDHLEGELKLRIIAWLLNMKLSASHLGSHHDHEFKSESRYMLVRMAGTTPLTFSREDVYCMLRTVREQEKRMGWKCPEPEE